MADAPNAAIAIIRAEYLARVRDASAEAAEAAYLYLHSFGLSDERISRLLHVQPEQPLEAQHPVHTPGVQAA